MRTLTPMGQACARLKVWCYGAFCNRARAIAASVSIRCGAVPGLTVCLIGMLCVAGGPGNPFAAEKAHHTGTKLEGYATVVKAKSITVFDKKGEEIEVHTDKDYSSLVGIAAPVTVWYTSEGGVNHLEDIVFPTRAATFVPADTILNGIKRIIILPQAEDVENSAGLVTAISAYLTEHVGIFVAPPELATEIANRNQDLFASLDPIDPATGDVDMERYLEAQADLVTQIANKSRSDGVLLVRMTKVKAKVRGSIASWDDMTEPVASRTARTLSPLTVLGGRGWVYAATADMSLWNKAGKMLWKKRRGFAVLGMQTAIGARYRERPLTEVYQDNETMQRWLTTTLGELAPIIKSGPPA